jgi:hypothetical protein
MMLKREMLIEKAVGEEASHFEQIGTNTIAMDTDYLTPMAYACISLADEASDVLKSEIGAACSDYPDEGAYLAGILAGVKEIEEDPEDYLDWWNLLEETDVDEFVVKVRSLRAHIEQTIATPIAERGKPEFTL